MKKAVLTNLVVFGTFFLCSAQTNYSHLNNYTQPAPNVASLGKYVDYPVSYYTGVPEISVPLYNLKDGGANINVSLSYHASGIKVSEVASWVGLGWALNAGGMITRTVRGTPDEGSRIGGSAYAAGGYYRDSGLSRVPLLPHPGNDLFVSGGPQQNFSNYTVSGLSGGNNDGEPDLFTFNFNGYSGKFVFDEHRTPRLLSDDNLKIAVYFDSYNSLFTSWVITTPDGADYYFGENNIHEVTLPHSTSSGDDPNSVVASSWFLTKIIYPNTKDTVVFNYTPETYTYFDLGQESQSFNFMATDATFNMSTVCSNGALQQSVIRTTVNGLRLTSIKSKNDSVSFIADTARLDLANYSTKPRRLDSVRVYIGGQCFKQFKLSYNYFTAGLATNLVNLGFVNDSSDTKRLKLLAVQEFSGDGATAKPPYLFQYQDTFQLPRRLSYDQDHWGYSNDATGNHNQYFMPGINLGAICSSGGANREASWPQMEAAVLLSIKDPLGVTTSFQYEANIADYYYPYSNYVVGGLRIHSITTLDALTNLQTVRKYQYGPGVLFKRPNYIIFLQNEYYIQKLLGYLGYGGNNMYGVGMLKQSSSIVPLQDVQGNHIGYGSVREIFGNNGEGGYKDHLFQLNLNPKGNSRLNISNYASFQGVTTPYAGTVTCMMGNGHFNDIAATGLQYYTGYDVGNYYPYAPDQIDLSRGKLLSENTYDSSGTLLQSVINTYSNSYHEDTLIRGLKVYRTSAWHQRMGDFDFTTDYNDALTFYKLHIGVSHLIATSTIDYKDGKAFTNVARYGYESAYHTLKTSDTTVNSQGDSLISKTFYSFDYANGVTADSVVKKMKARNMLVPVATRLWKNHQLVSGTITQFKDFAASSTDTLINPYKIYSLDMSNPLTTTQAGENIALTGQLSTLIPTSTYFHEKATFNYNGTTGKISEQNLTSDKKQALIWDNQYSLPLAVVDNASVADIAYNSFESAETGNWSFTASSITSDASTPLGAKVYVLGSSNPITKSGLTTGKKYILSYWLKSGGSATVTGGTQSNSITGSTVNTSWTYKQVTITTTGTSISLTGSGNIDEVRLYPATAQMVTYTYDGLLRLTDQCSANSTISQYEYDSLNRLIDIKDQFGNVIKAFEYNYGSLSR